MNNHQHIHIGTLVLDHNRRYCICEPDKPACEWITLTCGCALDIWLNHQWIGGSVEGDSQAYWLYVKDRGIFLLSEHMVARYQEPEYL